MKLKNTVILLITSLIWGIGFVAQTEGGDAMGPLAFNCVRNLLASVVLIPVIKLLDALDHGAHKPVTREDKKITVIGGICCGVALCLASNLQQVGISMGTSAGKAGFLTACYIILVPILGIFIGKKCGWNVWTAVLMGLAGLYLLCVTGDFSIEKADWVLLLCALMFAVQILVIDYFSPKADGARLACIQFLTVGVLTLLPTLIFETGFGAEGFAVLAGSLKSWDAWIPLLYASVMSSGVAYTLQIFGQKGANPAIASLIMSLESVFAVLAGWLLLNQILSTRETFGCIIMFAAIILAQLPIGSKETA